MAISRAEANNFAYDLGIPEPSDLLENAIAWINGHLSPDDVFPRKVPEEWARANGFGKEE